MSQNQETACVLAAIILADEGMDCTAQNITDICKAAGIEVQPIWPILFAQYLEGKKVMDLLTSLGSAAPAAPAAAGAAAAAPVEEKKEEEKEEEEEVIGTGGLFGGDSSSDDDDSDSD